MGGLKELLLEDGRVTGLRLEAESGNGPVELKGTVVLASGGCEPTDRPMDSMDFFGENLGEVVGTARRWSGCFSFKYHGYSYLGGER